MTELLIGKSNDPGRRDYNEDRVDVKTFKSAGGLDLTVAVVADGVGGEERGEAAAQKAVDTVFDVMRASRQVDVPNMLEEAVSEANRRVHEINQRFARGACTLAIAAVHNIPNSAKLYVANVGDSRVYLCRQATEKKPAKLTQLTLDHSFANLMPIMGKLSKEAAAANPRADNIMRAIGPNPQVPVDLGFYVNTEDVQVANQRGRQGLPIKDGDSIVVCSDGLIKPGEDGRPYCRDEEIVDTVNRLEGEKAAKTLVSVALGRDTDDNVSAAVIQMPNTARAKAAVAAARRPYVQAAVGAVGLITLASILGWFLLNRFQQADKEAIYAQETEIAQIAVEQQARETTQAKEAAALEAERNAFATESAIANAERGQSVQETVAAMAALNEEACTEQNDYDFDVGRITFSPRLGETHIEGERFSKDLEAQWTVVNEGCPATNVRLVSVRGNREFIPAFINSTGAGQGNTIFEGESVTMIVTLDSIEDANNIDEELWFVVEAPDSRDLQLNNVNTVELKVPDDKIWIALIDPTPIPTRIVVEDIPTATDGPADSGSSQVAAVPRATNTLRPRPTNTRIPSTPIPPTRTPNYSATNTRRAEDAKLVADGTARSVNATRTQQAGEARNNQTRDANNRMATANAFNRGATATASAQKSANDFKATETKRAQVNQANNRGATQTAEAQRAANAFQATQTKQAQNNQANVAGTRQAQTRQAEQNARNFQATQTQQAISQRETLTRQAQVGAGIATQTRQAQIQQATANAFNAQATRTRQAQINAGNVQQTRRSVEATQTQQANRGAFEATQTRQAQINSVNATATRQEQIRQATRNTPTDTPRPVPPTNTPRPANTPIPAPVQPTTPPQANAVTPRITDTSCVVGANGFVNGTMRWTGQLGANQWFAIRIAPQGQSPQNTGTYVKNNITAEGQSGNNWALTGFGTGLAAGDYSWTVALLDNGNPIDFAPQTGCFSNAGVSEGGSQPPPSKPSKEDCDANPELEGCE